jgi:hypothetical protein
MNRRSSIALTGGRKIINMALGSVAYLWHIAGVPFPKIEERMGMSTDAGREASSWRGVRSLGTRQGVTRERLVPCEEKRATTSYFHDLHFTNRSIAIVGPLNGLDSGRFYFLLPSKDKVLAHRMGLPISASRRRR